MPRRGVLLASILITLLAGSLAPQAAALNGSSERNPDGRGIGGGAFRPDGWIKLCGLSLGCVIDPLPHPWRGKNVYNTTGARQTEAVDINEGEGVRFWITVENDGTESDTFGVQGCRGNRVFEVNSVVIGKHKRQDPGSENVTNQYKRGTLTFDLNQGQKAVFTINIITHFDKGVTYECLTQIHSVNDASAQDTVVAKMTTY